MDLNIKGSIASNHPHNVMNFIYIRNFNLTNHMGMYSLLAPYALGIYQTQWPWGWPQRNPLLWGVKLTTYTSWLLEMHITTHDFKKWQMSYKSKVCLPFIEEGKLLVSYNTWPCIVDFRNFGVVVAVRLS